MPAVLPANQVLYEQLVEQLLGAYGPRETLLYLARLNGYTTVPPTIHEFMSDPYYLGNITGNGAMIYGLWQRVLTSIYPDPFQSPYSEVILSGAIGTGKSTIAKIGTLYDLCKLLHLDDPHEKFHLLKTDVIIYALINATLHLSDLVLYGQVVEAITLSPYFKQLLTQKKHVLFPHNITVAQGSRFDQNMGQAVIGAVLDELNFQRRVRDQASNNYNSLEARIMSRFMSSGGALPCHMWLVSSKADDAAFLEQHMLKVQAQPHVLICDYKQWEVLREKVPCPYSGETFKVFIGNQFRDPFIVERAQQLVGVDTAQVLDVPIEYKAQFQTDIYRKLQDIAGVGTFARFKFLSSIALIQEMQLRQNPVTREVISLDFFDESQLIEYVLYDQITPDSRPKFLHIDTAVNGDRLGMASVRYDGTVTLERRDGLSGQVFRDVQDIFYVDFVLGIQACPTQQISLVKVKNFLFQLRERGYKIGVVSTDGYQSTQLRQELTYANILTDLISVDRHRDAYDHVKTLILEGRLNGVAHPLLATELHELVDLGHKIDHPEGGSKDVSDSLAGALWSAQKYKEKFQANTTMADAIRSIQTFGRSPRDSVYSSIFSNSSRVGVGRLPE